MKSASQRDRTGKMTRMELDEAQVYTSYEAAEMAGVTYRQLDYWIRQGAVTLEHQDTATPGSGGRREFTASDVSALMKIAALQRTANQILRDLASGELWDAVQKGELDERGHNPRRGRARAARDAPRRPREPVGV